MMKTVFVIFTTVLYCITNVSFIEEKKSEKSVIKVTRTRFNIL